MTRKGKKSRSEPHLPIFMHKGKILEKIKTNSVVIITGPTGCGKSTQVPKYLYESGYGINGIIACLHPRCIAAMSLAERVSHELNDDTGGLVGYQVRFFKSQSERTRIMFMTTGLMLQMMKHEESINNYTIIIIDEAHERSVQTDATMGRMKEILRENQFIKLVVMSATLNVDQIKNYYENCAVVSITNAKDNIKIIYRPPPTEDYIAAIKVIVNEILESSTNGHILIFLQSEEKVSKCRKSMKKQFKRTILLPFFASLDYDEKMMVFRDYPRLRKIIIATNVAETSLTIAGVDFVIDSGLVKRVHYDHDTGVEMWRTDSVSIAEANQRKGRTGRTGVGTCYRLYEEKCVSDADFVDIDSLIELFREVRADDALCAGGVANGNGKEKAKKTEKTADLLSDFMGLSIDEFFAGVANGDGEEKTTTTTTTTKKKKKKKSAERFRDYPEPEIKTANLGTIILTLKAMGKIDILAFPFIVPPDRARVSRAIADLTDLSLLHDANGTGGGGTLTNLGCEVSRLPLEPRLGKVASIASQLVACRADVVAIVAMLSVRNVLKSPSKGHAVHAGFASGGQGDLLMLRNLLREAYDNWCSVEWCRAHYVNRSCMKYAIRVARQLQAILPQPLPTNHVDHRRSNSENLVKKVFLSGFFQNVSRKADGGQYRTADDKKASLHKYSSVDSSEEIILFLSIQKPSENNLMVLRNCTGLNEQMLRSVVPQKFRIKAPLWKAIIDKLSDS